MNDDIKNVIYEIRGMQVVLDTDLAVLYEYEVRYLNQQVKRNIERFPSDFMFQLTIEEVRDLSMSQNVTSMFNYQVKGVHGRRAKLPFIFAEQGVNMLATVLRGETATRQSIEIMRAFKEICSHFTENTDLLGSWKFYIQTMRIVIESAEEELFWKRIKSTPEKKW